MTNELVKHSLNEVSPYDDDYPMALLDDGISKALVVADEAKEKICDVLAKDSGVAAQVLTASKKTKYVLDISEEMAKKIESGAIKLTTNKKGETFAQIVEKGGQFGKKIPIKKEDLAGINPTTMALAMQMRSMQEQLDSIKDEINAIGHNVVEVLSGQQNDRIAQYYTGVALYIQATGIIDEEFRKQLLSQSLRALSDATFQLKLQMETDIKYLKNKDFDKYKTKDQKRTDLIDQRMQDINKCLKVIHDSCILTAGIYSQMQEYEAMANTMELYQNIIDTDIKSNALQLAQWDKNDDGTDRGVWKQRAEIELNVKSFVKQISNAEKVSYIGVKENG